MQQLKEAPEWMLKSTVHSEEKVLDVDEESSPNSEIQSNHQTIPGM